MAKKTATKVSAKQNGGAPVVQAKAKRSRAKPVVKPAPEESEESEEDVPVIAEPAKRKAGGKKAAPPAKKSKKVAVPEPEPSDDEESDDAELSGEEMEEDEEESEEEAVAPKPVAKKAAAKAKNGKAAPAPVAEEESEEEDESEEEESEEEAAPVAKKGAAKAKNGKAAPVAEESEEEDESEEESGEEAAGPAAEEESEDEMVIKSAKSGAGLKKAAPASGEQVSIFVGNLPSDDGDRETKLREIFGDIALTEIRTSAHKNFAHVTLADSGDRDKALELNGTDMDGNTLKLDEARSKAAGRESTGAPSGNRVAMFGCQLSSDVIQEATGANDVFCLDAKQIAFLTFNTNEEAAELVKNGPVTINGNDYNVEMARPKVDRNDRGRGGRGGRGGFGGGRGGGFGDRGGRGGRGGGGFRGGRGGRGAGGRGGGGMNSGCRNCGVDGHFSRECPKPITCRKCQGEGHISTNCSK